MCLWWWEIQQQKYKETVKKLSKLNPSSQIEPLVLIYRKVWTLQHAQLEDRTISAFLYPHNSPSALSTQHVISIVLKSKENIDV